MRTKEIHILVWLQEWYKKQCDGDWEHLFGIKIYNIDNPGWRVVIDLLDTDLEDKIFEKMFIDHGDHSWITCFVRDGKFEGAGDSNRLLEILTIFKEWAES
ncbi:immunity 53 family protein [Eubacteriales bacterium OttesenSCG-928-M02]|nr:immunity 53 family protein [Eubacteriales bacterium OttesenSCG-928-M02]